MLFYLSQIIQSGQVLSGIPDWLISVHYIAIAIGALALSNKGEFTAQSMQSFFGLMTVFFVAGYFQVFQDVRLPGIDILAWVCLIFVPIAAIRAGFWKSQTNPFD